MNRNRRLMGSLVCGLLLACRVPAQTTPGFIRVNSDPPGAAVYLDGNMKDVTPVVLPDVEPGEHLLVLQKEGFRQTRQTVRLGPGQRMVVDLRLEPLTGLVLIHSTPPQATIQINDTDRGRTPLLITDLPLGRHRVTVTAEGCLPKKLDLVVKDRTPVKMDVVLPSSSARLALSSTPQGASVVLNGISMGLTPCELGRIPAGENTLELSLAGFEPFVQTIRVQAGQEETLDVSLKPIPSALTIVSLPGGARVYVDNQFRGEAPVALKDVTPGEYRIRAELNGYATLARTVAVPRNTTLVEEFRLELNSGILNITTEPSRVRVFVDGEEAGETTAEEGATDRVSKPLSIRLLPEGPHKVQLTREGYFSEDFEVEITRDGTTTRHVQMKRRFIPNYEVFTRTGAESGVLLEIEPAGAIRLEVRPGVIKTIPANQITSHRPLRER